MKQDLIKDVIQGMLPYLNNAQNEKLQEVLRYTLAKYEVTENQNKEKYSEQNYVELFLSAKRIEGCSEKSLKYYKATIEVLNIIKEHFTVDWYKRNPILSKINMSITGYYFKKCQSKDVAKQKAEQIVTLLNQMVEDFITATDERGE